MIEKKQNARAFLAIREERLNKLCADYKQFIRREIAAAGNEFALARALGKSQNYVRESLNGGVTALKKCAELIAALSN